MHRLVNITNRPICHIAKVLQKTEKKWQQDWIKKWPIILQTAIVYLLWDGDQKWCEFTSGQYYSASITESLRYTIHTGPTTSLGMALSVIDLRLLEMLPCSPVQFPLIYIHNLRICNPVAKFQPALNRKYSESGNTPAINYFRSQTHVVHWQVDLSGDSSHLITHLKNTIK